MFAQSATAPSLVAADRWSLVPVGRYPGMRALSWDGNVLYASRGYALLCSEFGRMGKNVPRWEEVARCQPALWRKITAQLRWSARLCRDGFHALAVLPSGTLVAAIPGAIITLFKGQRQFSLTHRIVRGTRPLHITATPAGRVFWGEYFDNRWREEVHIYESRDDGASWQIAYTFDPGEIRHIHNIVYDEWEDCLWVLTGDHEAECRVVRASLDFSQVRTVLAGSQSARAAALIPAHDALYFSSDTPLERNHIFRLDRSGSASPIADLSCSSIYGCRVGNRIFFSTMVEPSLVNSDRYVRLYGGGENSSFSPLLSWKKDFFPMRYFQYGNAILPDGVNTSGLLALSTIAVKGADFETALWAIEGTKSGDEGSLLACYSAPKQTKASG